VASTNIKPVPPAALVPRCIRCQSFVKPSVDEYWHIGDMTILFFRVTFLIFKGENSIDIRFIFLHQKYGIIGNRTGEQLKSSSLTLTLFLGLVVLV
jgi:hypothetical protein